MIYRYKFNCCGATVGSEQRHNQDWREIYKVRRIHHFLPECIAFNQTAQRYFLPECIAPRTTQIKTRGSSVVENVHRSLPRLKSFLCGKFSTARLEVLTNLRHAGVFQMSTMVNLGIGFQFKSLWLVQALNLTRRWAFPPRPRNGIVKVRKCHAMLFLRTCTSRKWMWFWPLASK